MTGNLAQRTLERASRYLGTRTVALAKDADFLGAIITAGMLRTMTVEDFQQAQDQLAELSSNLMADELRAARRDVRR